MRFLENKSDKVKIKKSELDDMYDIEDDTVQEAAKDMEKIKEVQDDYDIQITQGDKKLKEEFEEEY